MSGGRGLLGEGLGYGIVGGLQLVLDWGVFVALSAFGVATVPANLAGRVAGAMLGFVANGAWTFRRDGAARLGWRRLGRFLVVWAALAVLSTLAVHWIDQQRGLHAAWLGKPLVDAALAGLGFLASRAWIYR